MPLTRRARLPSGPRRLFNVLRRFGVDNLALSDTDKLARQLLVFLQSNPGLSWVSVSDESGTFTGAYRVEGRQRIRQTRIVNGKTPTLEYFVMPDGTWRLALPEFDSAYDPRGRPFYTKTKAARGIVWLEPYIFYDQGVPGISCAAPLEDRTGRFRGVVTADFDLNALSDFVARISVSPNSRFFLYTADETLLAHPTRRVVSPERQKATGKLLTLADTDDPLVDAFRGRVSGIYSRVDLRSRFNGSNSTTTAPSTWRPQPHSAWVGTRCGSSEPWRPRPIFLPTSGGARHWPSWRRPGHC